MNAFPYPTGWRYVYRAIDQAGQVIDVFAWSRRDSARCHHCANRGCSLERQLAVRLRHPGWATIKSG